MTHTAIDQEKPFNSSLSQPANSGPGRTAVEIQRIVHAICHDFQAPTRHIKAFTELLVEELGDVADETIEGFTRHVQAAVETLDGRLEALGRYSEVYSTSLNVEPHPMRPLASEAVDRLQVQIADRGAKIEIEDLPVLSVDRQLLTASLAELICNSLKFSPDQPQIRIYATEDANGSTIVVEDSGCGLRPEQAATAFDLFRRFHPASIAGTGTGLAIVRRAIERHGGATEMLSEVGCGTAVQMHLPAPAAKSALEGQK